MQQLKTPISIGTINGIPYEAIAVGDEPFKTKKEIIPDILVREAGSEDEPESLMELTKFAFNFDLDDEGYNKVLMEINQN